MTHSTGYWEDRYARGGTSGEGSVGKNREWKWSIIEKYVHPQDVIDMGCGDLSFWEGRECQKYLGIDISRTILDEDAKARPCWNFVLANSTETLEYKAKTVFCFDLLFHLVDDKEYYGTLTNLSHYAEEWLFIFTWTYDPKRLEEPSLSKPLDALWRISKKKRATPEKFRPLDQDLGLFEEEGLHLKAKHRCPYDRELGAMYVFNKEQVNDKAHQEAAVPEREGDRRSIASGR